MFSSVDTEKGTYKVYAPYRLLLFYFIIFSVLIFCYCWLKSLEELSLCTNDFT